MFWKTRRRWDLEVDVVIVGTGAAGLSAALAAHDAGASVALVERTEKVGGTTAVSGGVVWVPRNHHMADVAIDDDRDEAMRYVTRLADGRGDPALAARYIDVAPSVVRWLEDVTPARFAALARYPDYRPELPGGRPGGRSLDPGLYDTNRLGEWKDRLRRSPSFGMTAMSVAEATEWGVFSRPLALPFDLLAKRLKQGLVCYGGALVGPLLEALVSRGVEPLFGVRVRELVLEEGRVVGARGERAGEPLAIGAKAVVLASGGFEWSAELCERFLAGPVTHPNSPPWNEGDALRMAMSAGADLGTMTEAWWCPSVSVPGEEYDGKQLFRGDFAARALPHAIVVNRRGTRFVNEAQNYNDMAKAFARFDPERYEHPNVPAWIVFDAAYRRKYMVITAPPGGKDPPWLVSAGSLGDLAAKVGIDGAGLAATVERFNRFAAAGVDDDFGRGASLYDRFYGDPDVHPNPNLGAIAEPPFFSLPVHPGAIGTKGGPRIDAHARVLGTGGEPIAGLYAAGNAAASPMGSGYPGAGSTIGLALTFGWLAGRHAAGRPFSDP